MTGYFRAYSNRVREASRELEERELRVYLALLSYCNCDGLSWPGYKLLCEITGICSDAVRDALQALVTKKYIVVVRQGARDPITGQQWANVYQISGAFVDEDCMDNDAELPNLELSSNEDSNTTKEHNQLKTTKGTQPEKPPSTTFKTFSEVEVPKANTTAKTGKEKTPERSSIPKPPNPVPPPPSPRFFNGSLREYAGELPEVQETVATTVYMQLEHKMPIRLARYLVASYGETKVLWALAHLRRQREIHNPAGYIRHLLEKDAIEQRDAAAPNPGDKYIMGEYSDYIEH